MSELLIKPKDNLIHQSLHSRGGVTTNGDGYGIGWYGNQTIPGLFRSIRPAWNDLNLIDLATNISSPMFISHVRAASLAPIQETNCHPFRYKQWLFVHNGQISNFSKIHQRLLGMIHPKYFANIQGSTDSEVMFHLALSFGLDRSVKAAVSRMIRAILVSANEERVSSSVVMTLGISDGINLWSFRYGTEGKSPTLFVSPGVEDIMRINPNLKGKFGKFAACVVSEPIGNYQQTWKEIPHNSVVQISNQSISISKFVIN